VGRVIGELLPLAIGVAISPLPIIAAIVMLLTRRAGLTSLGLLVGWVVGIVVATVVFVFVASTVGLDESSGPSTAGSWVKIGWACCCCCWRPVSGAAAPARVSP
jgi:hypothetical protein